MGCSKEVLCKTCKKHYDPPEILIDNYDEYEYIDCQKMDNVIDYFKKISQEWRTSLSL